MTTLKPFDGKEFFLKRPSGLIALPSEEAHRRTIEICAELGMHPPEPYEPNFIYLHLKPDTSLEEGIAIILATPNPDNLPFKAFPEPAWWPASPLDNFMVKDGKVYRTSLLTPYGG